MEPWRPLVDRKVLEFVQVHTFHPADFTIRSDGVCRLNPQMVKYVVRQVTQLSEQVNLIASLLEGFTRTATITVAAGSALAKSHGSITKRVTWSWRFLNLLLKWQ
jgi:CRISPR/Cas system-associated endonuclease Cas1